MNKIKWFFQNIFFCSRCQQKKLWKHWRLNIPCPSCEKKAQEDCETL